MVSRLPDAFIIHDVYHAGLIQFNLDDEKMSWIADSSLTWFQKFCINVLKCGPIPQHLAFIMDGNRRFAKKIRADRKDGHTKGFDKLAETLQWCLELGIREVTVYAFSIENFKRSSDEVDTLMDLAREKYKRLMEEKEKIMAEGVRIRVIGNLELLPKDIRKLVAEAMLMTKDNSKVFLNIAFAYTSREEITNAIKTVANGVRSGALKIDDIDEQLLSNCMYTNHSKNPDLLIRTSGESRLSDFLLWQIQNTQIYFADVLWPEFCIWHLLYIVFKYQISYKELKSTTIPEFHNDKQNERVQEFLKSLDSRRMTVLQEYQAIEL